MKNKCRTGVHTATRFAETFLTRAETTFTGNRVFLDLRSLHAPDRRSPFAKQLEKQPSIDGWRRRNESRQRNKTAFRILRNLHAFLVAGTLAR